MSAIGTQLFNVALMYWLLETTGSATTMGLVLTSSLLPVAVLSVFTGALVDRLPRKWLIVGADIVRGFLCLAFVAALVVADGETAIAMLLVYALVAGVATTLFSPALRAVLPDIVGAETLQRANGAMQSASSFALVVGTSLGGFLYASLGAAVLFLVNGVSFLLSAVSEAFVKVPPQAPRTARNLMVDVREGWRFMIRDRGLRRILITIALMNVASAPLTITLPMLVRDHHGGGPELLGLLAASQGVGSPLAAAFLGSKSLGAKVRPSFGWMSLWVCALSLLLMISVDAGLALMMAFALYGAGLVCFNVPIQTAIQRNTPSAMRGRVISASTTVVAGVMPIAAAITGVAIDAIGQNVTLVWSATASLFVACGLSIAASRPAREYLGRVANREAR